MLDTLPLSTKQMNTGSRMDVLPDSDFFLSRLSFMRRAELNHARQGLDVFGQRLLKRAREEDTAGPEAARASKLVSLLVAHFTWFSHSLPTAEDVVLHAYRSIVP